ncbi:MAG: helix-turn-helix transcriptional regulator [Firmicutes bacterium]|nr:helix-turn-helix transcriptional regulator [Bacillota bacterium]
MNKLELIEQFAYNLERLRNKLGYSQDQMSKCLDVSSSTYRRIINHETTKVDLYFITKLYELTHQFAFQFCNPNYKEDRRLRIVSTITELDDTALKDIENYVNFRKAITFNKKGETKIVPFYHPVGELSDNMIFNSFSYTQLDISSCPDSIKWQVDCALEILNNHFHPTYHLNDILLIAQRPPRDGDIGLFIEKETRKMFIRVFKMESPRKLIPVSDSGRIIEVDEKDIEDMNKWIKFGVVVSKMY